MLSFPGEAMLAFKYTKIINSIVLYTFDRILCNIHYFRIFQLHCDGTNVLQICKFSNFHIAELQQGTQIGAISARIFDAFKGCARAP